MNKAQFHKDRWKYNNCAVIAAHPDDETLWTGGLILLHPEVNWIVLTLCRKSDPERSSKFYKTMNILRSKGIMGDLDDGPEQLPLAAREVQNKILELFPYYRFDLIITHGLWGEYTQHLRHEETGKAVTALWASERLLAREIWRFAYEDGGGKYLPRPIQDADIYLGLSKEIWQRKQYIIITEIYGFSLDSFEVRATPRQEAFWRFRRDRTIREA